MQLSLGFSPCPNDTFIFDALIHQKVDTEGLSFDLKIADVEELNRLAFEGALDITKLSYHALGHVLPTYILLNSGSALGNNCGPLLIGTHAWEPSAIDEATIAIPGKYTTANFLLGLAFPNATKRKELLFSEIEGAVLAETVDLGLIIHENRFTYQERGLVKIIDLGEYWESTTQLPIPLGGIVIKRAFPLELQQKVDRVLSRSVTYALANPSGTLGYVKQYAQEMEESVMMSHIKLYVNDFTVSLGKLGQKAVKHLFDRAIDLKLIPFYDGDVIVKPF